MPPRRGSAPWIVLKNRGVLVMANVRKDINKRILDKKWEQLKKRGISRPKDLVENRKRLDEAHG